MQNHAPKIAAFGQLRNGGGDLDCGARPCREGFGGRPARLGFVMSKGPTNRRPSRYCVWVPGRYQRSPGGGCSGGSFCSHRLTSRTVPGVSRPAMHPHPGVAQQREDERQGELRVGPPSSSTDRRSDSSAPGRRRGLGRRGRGLRPPTLEGDPADPERQRNRQATSEHRYRVSPGHRHDRESPQPRAEHDQ